MSRNGSGTMAVINSFSPNTLAESGKVNANFNDIASELTNSLPRDGQAAMTGQFKAANGTLALPGIAFGSDTDTGFYRESGNTIAIVAGGAKVGSFDATSLLDALGVRISGIPTGFIGHHGATSAPAGWVRMNGRTIGSATSGATERANADTSYLFAFLWNNYSNTVCPVSTGRGSSAADDFAANKTIGIPDARGCALFGLDDMGSSAAGRITSVGSGIDGTANGTRGGAQNVTLIRDNLPNAAISVSISDPGHNHSVSSGVYGGTNLQSKANGGSNNTPGDGSTINIVSAFTGITAAFNLNGNVTQQTVNKMPPAILTTFVMKL